MRNLDRIFYPRSIAVVGATENTFKWGSYITTNIIDGGFKGPVYPVAHNRETVYGRKAYPSLTAIEGEVDLVFITTPSPSVKGVLAQCVEKGIKNAVIITSGFSETGGEGKLLEDEIVAYAREHGLCIVGPNTMGIANLAADLYACGIFVRPNRGKISIVTQSGNVGNQIMEWAEQQDIGIGKFVGSGNEGMLRCEDYLEYLRDDKDTSVVLMYIEGLDDGRAFLEAARAITAHKPVIALKAGRTDVGSKAAASHTGAMAGSYATCASALEQSGVVLTKGPMELLTLSSAFDALPLPRGNRIGVVSLGGGWGVITADECEERGLTLPPLPRDVYEKLDSMLPSFWSKGNPVDLVGQPDRRLFEESTYAMVSSDAYDAVILLGMVGSIKFVTRIYETSARIGFGSMEKIEELNKLFAQIQSKFLDNIADLMARFNKPIYPVALISSPEDTMIHYKEGAPYKVVIYKTPEEAVFCLQEQYRYFRYLQKRGLYNE